MEYIEGVPIVSDGEPFESALKQHGFSPETRQLEIAVVNKTKHAEIDFGDLHGIGKAGKCCHAAHEAIADSEVPLHLDTDGQTLLIATTEGDASAALPASYCPFCGTKLIDEPDALESEEDLN